MEGKQHGQSVIARLMGLDEFPPRQHLPVKRRRVLSENYIQKMASIGIREKSSFSTGLGINSQKHRVVKDVLGVEMPEVYSREKISQKNYTNSSKKRSHFKDSEGTSGSLLSTKHLRDPQLDPNTDMPHRSTRIIVVEPSSGKYRNTKHQSVSFRHGLESNPVDLKYKEFTEDENGTEHNEKPGRASSVNSLEPLPHGFSVPRTITQRRNLLRHELNQGLKLTSREENITDTFLKAEVLKPPPSSKSFNTQRKDDALSFFSKRPSFAKEAKKQNVERRTLTNDLQEVETTRRSQSLGEIPASENSLYGWHLRQKVAVTEKHSESMNQKQKANEEYRDLNSKETDQHSPNSVLEQPFQEKKPCISAFDSLCSVARQLQFLETTSEETYSEGSEMGVSSDGESETGSMDVLQDSENILKGFKTAEGRDFSYLVDVLDEASLHGMNLGTCFETWHSLECPVNPSVFHSLEKKYGKQTSWLKSERKLLFDHINSGLSEILHSFLEIYVMEKSLKRRCCSTMRRTDIEEELWKMLVSHENETHKDLSGKAIGNETKWLQAEEEIGNICREIEKYLLDELAAELALH